MAHNKEDLMTILILRKFNVDFSVKNLRKEKEIPLLSKKDVVNNIKEYGTKLLEFTSPETLIQFIDKHIENKEKNITNVAEIIAEDIINSKNKNYPYIQYKVSYL